MALGYITQAKDYWIAPNAVNITLNALGDANRIQGSVSGGAVISCYIEDIKPGGDNGDGLLLDNGRNPKRWSLSLSPTYFNNDSKKYVYAAIPRSTSVGSLAVIVFPSQKLDIYGRAVVSEESPSEEQGEQIGSTDYFYVCLQGLISAPKGSPLQREWTHECDYGSLGTYQDIIDMSDKSDWYSWNNLTQVVTFLKNIAMADGSKFQNLKAVFAEIDNYLQLNGDRLTGVAKAGVTPDDSADTIVTPAYLDEFGNTRYLSKQHDDAAAGLITFLQGLVSGTYSRDNVVGASSTDTGAKIFPDGTGDFLHLIFSQVLKSKGSRSGFLDGQGITLDAATGKIEADAMEVRGFLKVMELVINRLQLMESDYSFTEGDTTERIDFSDNGQRMVLTMHKEHDNDHTPFYPGDILYAKVNDLLDHGTYYTCWVRVVSIDQANNTIKVVPYGGPSVPGAKNFTFLGTEIDDADFLTELQHDYESYPDGYEKILSLTRHGNVADGLLDGDVPSSYSDEVKKSQQARQQSWVLSTTDKRLSFFWNVDEPIVRDENYALCLGILPDLANLPSTRDKTMPSLYVNTIFYDNQYRANYPARVIKEDRGQWVRPDSTVPQPTATTADGEVVYEPYHYRSFTRVTWLLYRNNPSWARLSDDELRQKMMLEFKVDLEVSRVWHHGCLWECLVDETSAEPGFTPQAWKMVSGKGWWVDFQLSQAPVVNLEDVSLKATPVIMLGDDDVSAQAVEQSAILAVTWTRHGNADGSQTAADELWQPTIDSDGMTLLIDHRRSDASRRTDCGPLWETLLRVAFVCKVTLADGSTQETELLIA